MEPNAQIQKPNLNVWKTNLLKWNQTTQIWNQIEPQTVRHVFQIFDVQNQVKNQI